MRRLDNWPRLLGEAIEAREDMPHEWGVHDCCAAPCYLIEAMMGVNPWADFITYKTREEASEKVTRLGGFLKMFDGLTLHKGFPERDTRTAQRGDLVLVRLMGQFSHRVEEGFTHGHAPGIIDLTGRGVLLAGSVGWTRASVNMVVKAWKI